MVVEGGMGVVTQQLATMAMAAGARIHTASPVRRIEVESGGGAATGLSCWLVWGVCLLESVGRWA